MRWWLLALLAVVLPSVMSGLVFQKPAYAGTTPGTAFATDRVVLVGIPGLLWSDVTERGTPTLWRLTREGAAASLSVRATKATTCPVDGWLTVSAGQRARLAGGDCGLPPSPAQGRGGGANVPGWAAIKRDNAHTAYEAQLGLLGDALHRAGECTTAIGPGAAFGAADGAGHVDHYVASVSGAVGSDWTRCAFTAVDVDALFRPFVTAGVDAAGDQAAITLADRREAAAAADNELAKVMAAAPSGTRVVVAGLSDSSSIPHLHAVVDSAVPGYLTAPSTRRTGLVTLTDVTASVLGMLDVNKPAKAIGSAWRVKATAATPGAKIRKLADMDSAAQAVRTMSAAFFLVLFAAQLLLYGVAALTIRGRRGPPRGVLRVAALAVAAAPVSTLLAGLVPWWRADHPAPALLGCVLACVVAVTGLALAGPWRRGVLGPGLVIAALTAVVLGCDVVTGSGLQLHGFMGYSPLVGGRFYGFGNGAFAVFATGALLTAAWAAERPLRAGRRGFAVAAVLGVGVVAMALDGSPSWGADFGGVLSIVVATAVLATAVAGRRLSLAKLGLYLATGLVIVLAFAFADSLRPVSSQTHLGHFWEQLQSGSAFGVLVRKFGSMVHSLTFWPYTVTTLAALAFLFWVLARPRPAPLDHVCERVVTMRAALGSVLTLVVLATLMNDSGVVIPALALSLAVPLTLALALRVPGAPAAVEAPPVPEPEVPRPAPTA